MLISPGEPTPEQPHRNHGLFSDHYLNSTLPTQQEWKDLAEQVRPAMKEITAILGAFAPSTNEAQTGQGIVRVYALFGLAPEEIAVVEESTTYRYGEVQGYGYGKCPLKACTLPSKGFQEISDRHIDHPE